MTTQTKLLVVGSTLVAFLALHVPDVDARGRVRLRGSALRHGTHHSGPVLSREQLRSCVAQQDQLNIADASLDRIQAVQKEKEAELGRVEKAISQREPLVDQYSQESVDSFNGLIMKQRRLVARYNKGLPAYNVEVANYQSSQQSFNIKCAGHAYYENDMKAVLAGQ